YSTVTLRLPYGLRLSSSVTGGVLMTRNLLTKLRATNSWPLNGSVPANGAAYPGLTAQKIFYNERSGVPAQPSPAPDRAPGAQGPGPVPLTLASAPEVGQPAFRASQLSRHFFGRYTDQADEMSDLPRAARDPLAQALLPRLLTAERELACDGGTTRKT